MLPNLLEEDSDEPEHEGEAFYNDLFHLKLFFPKNLEWKKPAGNGTNISRIPFGTLSEGDVCLIFRLSQGRIC